MATLSVVKRLANPYRRRKASTKAKRRRNPRRKLTAKQIKFFGTKAQRAALKRRRKPAAKRNTHRRRSARKNPALLVTLGAVNPQRRRKSTMAKRRRKSNPRRRRTTLAVAPVRRRRRRVARRSNPIRRRRAVSYRRRRRNPMPSLGGTRAFSGEGLKMIAGGLVGVTATKFIANMLPAAIKAPLGTFGPVVANGIGAFIAGYIGNRFLGGSFGSGILFGGLMQTGSTLINTISPGLKFGDYPIGISGLGELVPGQFSVPQNPLRLAPPPTTQARVTMNGLSRSFGTAF